MGAYSLDTNDTKIRWILAVNKNKKPIVVSIGFFSNLFLQNTFDGPNIAG